MSTTLTHRTVKNSVYSLIGYIWPLLLAFVATPIVIKGLGSARFGFYTLLNSVPLIFGFLDFGLSYTLIKQLSENRENQGARELSVTFSSTAILYAILGLFGLLFLLILHGEFSSWFGIPSGAISSYTLAFFILGMTFMIKMLTVPLSQIPYALQRQDIPTNVSLVNSTLLQVGSIIVIKTGHGVMSLLLVQLISAAFLFVCFYFTWHHLAPSLKFLPILSKQVVKVIGQQGFWLFIRNNMGNVLAQLDKFVLGIFWGPTAVGFYSAAQMIPEKISSTSFSLSHIFFPVFSEVSSQEEKGSQRIKTIFRRSLGIITIITSGLTIVVLLYGFQLIHYWVSLDFAEQTIMAIPILALTYFLLSLGNFIQAFLSGLKELRFLALSIMFIAVADVLFMFIFIPKYSVNGASVAYLLSALPIPAFIYYIEYKYFYSRRKEIANFYLKLIGKIFLVGVLTFGLAWYFVRPFVGTLLEAVILGGLTFILYIGLFWLFNFFQSEDKELLKFYGARIVGVLRLRKN